jgi:spermidine/putrescine transport system permease protein
MQEMLRRYGYGLTFIMSLLVAFWLLAMVVVPNIILLEFSFRPYLPMVDVGGPKDVYSFNNYLTFFTSPIHIEVFFKTVIYSSLVTGICLIITYPLAYILSKVVKPTDAATIFLMLLVPLWVSEILRSFAWFIILGNTGPLNALLLYLGLIEKPVRWIVNYQGVIFGLVYAYILFMLFPIYNAISALDTNQIEASKDLGAGTIRTHWRVVIPHSKPGIASGCVMVFMLSAGSVIVPSTLASTNSRWFTEVIQQWMFEGLDWQVGSAYAFLLLVLCIMFVSIVMRVLNVRLVDIAK